MKVLFYILFAMIFFSWSCSVKQLNPPREPNYPDKDLKEIIIRGKYVPEDKERVKEYERDMRERGRIEAWESFEEKYPHLLDKGDEGFTYTGEMYCYNETSEKNPVFNKNLRARLYDKKGNLLSEDFLRWDGSFLPIFLIIMKGIRYLL